MHRRPERDPAAGGRGTVVLAVMSTLMVSGSIAAQDEERVITRVRGAHPEVHRMIREADRRSATFRAMIDEVQRSNAIVVVQFGLCANGRFRSCVIGVGGGARERHIRVVLLPRPTDDRLMATIAHELQHALEILREADVTDGESAQRLYRRIGLGDCQRGLSEICETEAALELERKVLDDLDRRPG
jgi:hypothetical protein